MRIVIAADCDRISAVLGVIEARQGDVVLVGHASTEGELFKVVRAERPEAIVIDRLFRPRVTTEWLAYLHRLSGGAAIITVQVEEVSG
jgi:hypothetical protein